MVRRERLVNDAFTTLSASITAVTTTLNVADGSVFPSEGDYRLMIESEVVLIISRSGNALVSERGVDGTTAVSHSDNTRIEALATKEQLEQYIDDVTGGSSDRNPVRLLNKSDTILTASDFTDLSMGTASVSDDAQGGIVMLDPQTTGGFRMQTITPPSTPYTLTVKFIVGPGQTWSTAGTIFGIFFRENSTGEFILNYYEPAEDCHVAKYTAPSGGFDSFLSGEIIVDSDSTWIWQQIEDNGTTLFWRVSSDGINFFEIGSEGRTVFMAGGPDEIGWALNSRGLTNKLLHLKSWRET